MKIYHFETLESTQDKAKELMSEGVSMPFAVRTDIQTKGRGRSGNQWVSPVGNLYSSIVIPLHTISAKHAGQYSFLTAVAVMECLNDYGVTNARNKWPNDILVEGKKIAGILLESDSGNDGLLNALMIGVGVNLESAPEGAISLRHCVPLHPHSRPQGGEGFLQNLITHLQINLEIIHQNGFAPIREKWLSKAHGLGAPLRVRLPNETFNGIFSGLDEDGALLVNVDGHLRKVYSGDVFFG